MTSSVAIIEEEGGGGGTKVEDQVVEVQQQQQQSSSASLSSSSLVSSSSSTGTTTTVATAKITNLSNKVIGDQSKDMQNKGSVTSNGSTGQVTHRPLNSTSTTSSSSKNLSNSNSSNTTNSQTNGTTNSVQLNTSKMSKSSTYNGKNSGRSVNTNNQVTLSSPASANCGPNQQQNIGQPPNPFLGTATMISPYMNVNMNAAARLHQATTAAACMSPYSINRLYPSPSLAAAATALNNPYAAVNASLTNAGYHTHPGHQMLQAPNHTNPHHVSGHSIYQTSRMPASSPPVSSSNTSGSSSQGSSTSGIGSSASSTGGNIGLTNSNNSNSNNAGGGTSVIQASQSGQMTTGGTNNSGNNSTNNSSSEQLSKTNLYIRGLQPNTSDKDLYGLCSPYGAIISTKAILDKNTNKCKGYGFVDFESPLAAEAAVKSLQNNGYQAQMAKCTDTCRTKGSSITKASNTIANSANQMTNINNNSNTNNSNNASNVTTNTSVYSSTKSSQQQEQDPTNLYIANLPPYMTETELEAMLSPYGTVVSTRILRDSNSQPRGVGFARMESKEKCDTIIMTFNNKLLPSSKEPLLVKFADGGNKKKNQFRTTDNRWRDNVSNDHLSYGYHGGDQQTVTQNGVAPQLVPASLINAAATAAGYSPHQRTYTTPPVTASYPVALQAANAHPWVHATPQYHLIPSQHMQTQQMIQSHTQMDPSAALHFGALMPQLTAQVSQLQLSGHSYITGNPNQYGTPGTPGMYAQAGTPIMQSVQISETADGQNHPSSGNSSVGPQDEMMQGQHAYQVYGPK